MFWINLKTTEKWVEFAGTKLRPNTFVKDSFKCSFSNRFRSLEMNEPFRVINSIFFVKKTYWNLNEVWYRSSSSNPSNFATTLTARAGGLKSKLYKTRLLFIFVVLNAIRVTWIEARHQLAWTLIWNGFYAIWLWIIT